MFNLNKNLDLIYLDIEVNSIIILCMVRLSKCIGNKLKYIIFMYIK